jgi:cysteine desulfurase
MKTTYLDHIAATPLRPEVFEAMRPFLTGLFGNPQSLHAAGRQALAAVDAARQEVAALIGATEAEI